MNWRGCGRKEPCPILCIVTAISDVAGEASGTAEFQGWQNENFK